MLKQKYCKQSSLNDTPAPPMGHNGKVHILLWETLISTSFCYGWTDNRQTYSWIDGRRDPTLRPAFADAGKNKQGINGTLLEVIPRHVSVKKKGWQKFKIAQLENYKSDCAENRNIEISNIILNNCAQFEKHTSIRSQSGNHQGTDGRIDGRTDGRTLNAVFFRRPSHNTY